MMHYRKPECLVKKCFGLLFSGLGQVTLRFKTSLTLSGQYLLNVSTFYLGTQQRVFCSLRKMTNIVCLWSCLSTIIDTAAVVVVTLLLFMIVMPDVRSVVEVLLQLLYPWCSNSAWCLLHDSWIHGALCGYMIWNLKWRCDTKLCYFASPDEYSIKLDSCLVL